MPGKLMITLLLLISIPIFANEQQTERGYQFLLNGPYTGCGIPLTVATRIANTQKLIPTALREKLFATPFQELGQVIQREGHAQQFANLPSSISVFTSNRGIDVLNINCLSCHADRINGETIIGLGNRSRDFTQDLRSGAQALSFFAWTPEEKEEVRLFQRSIQAIAPYMQSKTVGVNPAVNITYALFSHRDANDFTWSETPIIAPPPRDFPPVAVPPWWRMKTKQSMFYSGEFVSHHHRIMALAGAFCLEHADELRAMEDQFLDVEAYIRSLKAPPYPGKINQKFAARGARIFNRNCASCHGRADQSFPELIIPIEIVGTDPTLMEQQTGAAYARFRDWGAQAFRAIFDDDLQAQGKRGYLAPSLTGIWAVAPYLHNGSVPSLEAVLNSKIRPKYWRKLGVGNDRDYDVENMAVRYEVFHFGRDQVIKSMRPYIYDTTQPGYGNQGHTFGDDLSHAERRAVLEYLKTL